MGLVALRGLLHEAVTGHAEVTGAALAMRGRLVVGLVVSGALLVLACTVGFVRLARRPLS
ncbi:MAG: hypothetical protein R3F59_07895 [Myxococcota bacterium]